MAGTARRPVIFWFRRDLRLSDHPALAEAAEAGPVIPLFVDDPALRRRSGKPRLAFLRATLAALDASIGGHLVIRSGSPIEVLSGLAEQSGAKAVYATDDFGPYGRARDTAVGEALAANGITVSFRDSPYAVAPGLILTRAGTPYRVFTPFSRAWEAVGWAAPGQVVTPHWVEGLASNVVPSMSPVAAELPDPGEDAAWERVETFLARPISSYGETRDTPGVDGTSRLSPYLKWGTLHPRQLLARLGPHPSEAVFRAQLCWREFYADVLFNNPDSARTALVAKMSRIDVDTGRLADERYLCWCEGRTGYPIVDAGMRQLLAEGWMHNRVRMIAASFLVKDLHIDWTRGARWFMRHLVDGDLASNQHGWQWVAGSGTDASPYFRIFNPVTQSKKFDPEGRYLRRWLPELAHLTDSEIHQPWRAKAGPPAAYPEPIVDHGAEREESLSRYHRLQSVQ